MSGLNTRDETFNTTQAVPMQRFQADLYTVDVPHAGLFLPLHIFLGSSMATLCNNCMRAEESLGTMLEKSAHMEYMSAKLSEPALKPSVIILTSSKTIGPVSQMSGLFGSHLARFKTVRRL